MTQNAKHRRPKPQARQAKPAPPTELNPVKQWLRDHNLEDEEEEIVDLTLPLTVEQLFAKINNNPSEVTGVDLFALSDLNRADAEYVRTHWLRLPATQRRGILEQVVTTAEEQLDLAPGEFLRIALRDEDSQVRQLAVEGLWEDESEDLIGPYIQMLQNDGDAKVQAVAATALGTYVLLGELEELQPALAMRVEGCLFEVLEDKTQPLLVQCRALESLAFSSDEGLRPLIEEAYYSPYEEMRLSALRAMGRSSDIRWRKMAQAELQSPDAAMRAEAAIACGELEHKAATKELLGLLGDEEQIVRLSTIYALGHIGGKTIRDVLRKIAADTDHVEEAEAAEEALEEMLFFANISATIEQLQDDDDESERVLNERDDDDFETFEESEDEPGPDDDLRLDSESLWDRWSGKNADGDENDDDDFDDDDDEFEDDDDDVDFGDDDDDDFDDDEESDDRVR